MTIVSRKEARARALPRYFTGKPCKHGHIAERVTANGTCCVCARFNDKKQRDNRTPERRSELRAYHRAWSKSKREQRPGYRPLTRRYLDISRKEPGYAATYVRSRFKSDRGFYLRFRLRRRLLHALKGALKSHKTFDLVGCSAEQLVAHIESLFQPGMSWDNRDEWHVDHIIPCAAFDLTQELHQRACFHYTNLQPLWGKDNRSKSGRHDPGELEAWLGRFRSRV